MLNDVVQIFIDPRVMGSKLMRRLIKIVASNYGAKLSFRELSANTVKGVIRGFFYLDVPRQNLKELTKRLKSFNIGFSKKFKEAVVGLFELRVVADALAELEDGIPIGVSRKTDRFVLLPKSFIGVCRERITPLFLSQIFDSVLWIGYEFQGYREFLELIDKLRVGGLNRGALFELAKIISEETIGRRYTFDLLEKLSREESLLEDEELVISTDVDRVWNQIKEWDLLDFNNTFSEGKHLLDLSGLPQLASDIALISGINLGYELIIVDNMTFNPRILSHLRRDQSFIFIHKTITPNWASVIIDAGKGLIVKKKVYGSRLALYTENFTPIWEIFSGVTNE